MPNKVNKDIDTALNQYSKMVLILEDDIKKLALELDKSPISTLEEGKMTLNIDDDDRVSNALEILSIAGHITAFTEKVPVIISASKDHKTIKWITLDEAKKELDKRMAEKYFAEKARERIPKDLIDSNLKIVLRDDIRRKIEHTKYSVESI